MNLDDGSFLVASERFDHLTSIYSKDQLSTMKLLRVHPQFRVIALGVPVPKFPGNPLVFFFLIFNFFFLIF